MERQNEYIFKVGEEIFTLSYRMIPNSSASDSDEDPNRLSIKIQSENENAFHKEFSLSELVNACPILKKFDVKEIYETLQDNCNDKSIKFENTNNSMKILLNVKLNKKDLNPFIIVPYFDKYSKQGEEEVFTELVQKTVLRITDILNEIRFNNKKKFTNVIEFMPHLSYELLSTNERKFTFEYSLDRSRYIHFIFDSNLFYYTEYRLQFCIFLNIKNKDLDESSKINFANFVCAENTKNSCKMISINKSRYIYLNKGEYEMNLIVSKESGLDLYITDLNLCLSE